MVLRVAAGRNPRVLSDTVLPLAVNPAAAQFGTLFETLAATGGRAREIRITIADPLVRYFVIEAPSGLRSRAELQAAIAARFEEQFGLAPADWEISANLAPGHDSYLACAIPRNLLEPLHAGCASARLRLRSLVPYAVSEMNRWRRRLPRREFWFAAAGSGSVTLGYLAGNGWRGVRTHVAAGKTEAQLPSLIERDGLRLGIAHQAPLHCSGLVSQPVERAESNTLTRCGAGLWPGQNETWSREHRLALSGIWP